MANVRVLRHGHIQNMSILINGDEILLGKGWDKTTPGHQLKFSKAAAAPQAAGNTVSHMGSSQHCDSIGSDPNAILQTRTSTYQNEGVVFQYDLSLSLQMSHDTEHHQSINKDDNCHSAYHRLGFCTRSLYPNNNPTSQLLAQSLYR